MKTAALGLAVFTILSLAGECPHVHAQDQSRTNVSQTGSTDSSRASRIYTQEGISVEFNLEPVTLESGGPAEVQAGTDARVQFTIADAAGGKPLSNLRPAVWIDRRDSGVTDARACREKIQSFLQPGFNRRPTVNLNAYFILALNHEPNISVIDPLSGFGGSKLYTLVALPGSGADWVMSADRKRLYVSMPAAGQVAVIDTTTWKTIDRVDAGMAPTRLALQRDGRYLWIGNDGTEEAGSGITVFDTVTLTVVARVKTGMGHHEIAFTDDDSLAFVTNKQAGTLSVIDIRALARVSDIEVGALPVALAFSPLSKAVYVANEGDGTIVAVDGRRRDIVSRIKVQPGLGALRIPDDGPFGFVVNRSAGAVYIFDVSTNRLLHEVPVGPAPDHIAFTKQFAYVRSAGSEFVTMIRLAEVGREAAVSRVPAGQKAPRESSGHSFADAIVPAPEDGAVLIANPADKMIYLYAEGMAAPMGGFQNYRREPKALLVLDNGLRESGPGVYTTSVRLADPGRYDVAFLLDSPRLVNCFDVTIAENPGLPKPSGPAIRIEPLSDSANARVGENYRLRFKITDSRSNQPMADLADVGVLVFLAPGIWQHRARATSLGNGFYEVSVVLPQPGVYYAFFQCPSLNVPLNQIAPYTLQATK
jgi:DNA-binding beta-propeller fold protein YncE